MKQQTITRITLSDVKTIVFRPQRLNKDFYYKEEKLNRHFFSRNTVEPAGFYENRYFAIACPTSVLVPNEHITERQYLKIVDKEVYYKPSVIVAYNCNNTSHNEFFFETDDEAYTKYRDLLSKFIIACNQDEFINE